MPFIFADTEIKGLIVAQAHQYNDDRGLYQKTYEREAFLDAGICCEFTEASDIYSTKGALRGLHYQERYSQAKLIHVISGTLFDVALDLRKGSETFGKYHSELLSASENKLIYIPEGFAHGFITLSDSAIFSYQCSGKYDPASCGGILWNDPGLNIPWPLKKYGIHNVICTDKDKNWPTLEQYCIQHHQ